VIDEDSEKTMSQERGCKEVGNERYSLCLVSLVTAVGITTLYSIYISPCGTSWNDGI
jgi:hypothetical protein